MKHNLKPKEKWEIHAFKNNAKKKQGQYIPLDEWEQMKETMRRFINEKKGLK